MKLSIVLAATSLIALSACNSDVNVGSKIDTSKKSVKLNGMTVEEAYEQFHFTVTGSCEKDNVHFQPAGSEDIPFGGVADKTSGSLVLYIKKDGSYNGRYNERKVTSCDSSGTCNLETTFEDKKLNGRWSIEGEDLVLHGIGTARYFGTLNEKHVMVLTISKDFVSPRVIGKKTRVSKIGTNVGENDSSINEYCGR